MRPSTTGVELDGLELDAASGAYQAEYEPETTAPSMAVITLLAEVLDSSPVEMEPLNNTVDTEALDTLVAAADRLAEGVEVSLTYERYDVTVRPDVVLATPGSETDAEPDTEPDREGGRE